MRRMHRPANRQGWSSLPVSSRARERFELGEESFHLEEAPSEASLRRARWLADRINRKSEPEVPAEPAVSAGRFHALGLVSRFLLKLLHEYREKRQPEVFPLALAWLEERFGRRRLEVLWRTFDSLFPEPGQDEGGEGAEGSREPERSRDEARLESLILLWALNDNPAAESWRRLFDDQELAEATQYGEVVGCLRDFFEQQPGFGPDDTNLFDLLRAPARVAPDSLAGQLRFLLRVVGDGPDGLEGPILVGLDVLKEENKPVFLDHGGAPEPGPPEVMEFADLDQEEERFSSDRRWMPELVLVAKNVFVWLDQLSRSYGRPVRRLDEIPDRELDRLAQWGLSGLWLIGLWQRSEASRRIKELCGNPRAAASAYSLDGYRIADELGGEDALENLRRRAEERGIRMACDMVPNHFGIDSEWVLENPERFLSLPQRPFPGYSFLGPDLSPDPRVGIYLEDGYYTRQDAAVVFLRRDHDSGKESFIYHGNDGTGLPWNDTAQLDYLRSETREAVLEAIVEVAKKFPIVRFDAAMTLARRHVHRLWYPEPGQGGDIPSRAAQGLSAEDFDRLMPQEFWREAVDRVAAEAPDTLLLAEAFWLMEGYFVRSLGMHRVYHSAFMHMLRDEDNASFRQTVKNTLEFDPQILKRFVNYLTNPDEASAAQQFGTGEKYFGACTLLATLPGLPMFGHGQVEGLAEKYGMEYRQAYAEEEPKPALVERHETQIAPLLKRRSLFAGVEEFRLFDFEIGAGALDENVLAFTNGDGKEKVLVVFHNHGGDTHGFLRRCSPWRPAKSEGEELRSQTLVEALGWEREKAGLYRFRDQVGGLEYLVAAGVVANRGLELRLGPYECRVLLDFEAIAAQEEQLVELAVSLAGAGVGSLQDALEELHDLPARRPLEELLAAPRLRRLNKAFEDGGPESVLEEFEARALRCFEEVRRWVPGSAGEAASAEGGAEADEPSRLATELRRALGRILALAPAAPDDRERSSLASWLGSAVSQERRLGLVVWVCLRNLGRLRAGERAGEGAEARSQALFEAWRLKDLARRALEGAGLSPEGAGRTVAAMQPFLGQPNWWQPEGAEESPESPAVLLEGWLQGPAALRFLDRPREGEGGVSRRKSLADLLWWLGAWAWLDGSNPELEAVGEALGRFAEAGSPKETQDGEGAESGG